MMDFNKIDGKQMIFLMTGLLMVSVFYYLNDFKKNPAEPAGYFVIILLAFPLKGLSCFLSLVLYSFTYKYIEKRTEMMAALGLMTALAVYCTLQNNTGHTGISLVVLFLSVWMAVKSRWLKKLNKEVKRLRDDSKEKNDQLMKKNKILVNNQENELHIAVLRERNRIAREIHDNVGHLLSRSILQIGALMAVNRDETVRQLIEPVRNTLDEAMNSIRHSVHDLHKESFDIKNAAVSILEDLKGFEVSLECDFSMEADKDIKYTFLTILKEAVNNIIKYCDGDRVNVVIRELDEYYQMVIEDNGQKIRKQDERLFIGALSPADGIGLVNMKNRVEQMQGIIRFSNEKGFRIFISVPKNR